MQRIRLTALCVGFLLSLAAPAFGETLEEFYRRWFTDFQPDMVHPEARFLTVKEDGTTSIGTAADARAEGEQVKALNAKVEVLEFVILNQHEAGGFITMTARWHIRFTVGGQTQAARGIESVILARRADSYVHIFSAETHMPKDR